jgi:hypothetical protein
MSWFSEKSELWETYLISTILMSITGLRFSTE